MRKLVRFGMGWSFLLAMALSVVTSACAEVGTDPELRILVRVYNYARIPSPILLQAERDAGWIFRKAGVTIDWLECPLSNAQMQTPEACQRELSSTGIVLRILFCAKKAKLRLPKGVFGFAVPAQGAGHAFLASVYYDRLHDVASTHDVYAAEILGPAIAHEIGHLLLPSRKHARAGVLTGEWRKEQVWLATRRGLVFTREECEFIRADVAARMREQGTTPDPPALPTE